MTKSTLGDLVAAEMSKIVDSEEHVNMFSKVAKKKEDKSEDAKDKKDKKSEKSEKSEKSDKPNPFATKDKKDKKDKEDDKESKKKDKKSEKSDKKDKAKKDKKEDKKDDKKKEMTSESMNSFVNLLTKASDTLDNYGLHKSAALTLQALDTLIGEVAMDKFAQIPDDLPEGLDGLDEFADDPEMARLLKMRPSGGEGGHIDPEFLAELEGLDTGAQTDAFEDVDLADDTSVLDELGLSGGDDTEGEGPDLGEPLPELSAFLDDQDSRKVFSRLDAWMVRHAYDGDLMAAEDENGDRITDVEVPLERALLTPYSVKEPSGFGDEYMAWERNQKHQKRKDGPLSVDPDLAGLIPTLDLPTEVFGEGDDLLDADRDPDDLEEVTHDVNDHRSNIGDAEFDRELRSFLREDPHTKLYGKEQDFTDPEVDIPEAGLFDRMGPLGEDTDFADDEDEDEDFEDE